MQRYMLKSKIHRVTVTDSSLNYEGSLSVDKDLMDKGYLPQSIVNYISLLGWNPGTDEEIFITDFEAPISIDEYDNISDLNEFAEEWCLCSMQVP